MEKEQADREKGGKIFEWMQENNATQVRAAAHFNVSQSVVSKLLHLYGMRKGIMTKRNKQPKQLH